MRYVLTMYWRYTDGDSSVHTTVFAYTFATEAECEAQGEKWLALPPQLQKPIAYTCASGRTAYEVLGSPQRVE